MSLTVESRHFASIDDLEFLVIHAATQYEQSGYAEDESGVEITDAEYDAMYRLLKSEKPTSPAFRGTSPSEYKAKGGIVIHDPPMTSIYKADGDKKLEIYLRWLDSCCVFIKDKSIEIASSLKHDGVALRVNYVNGELVSAGLRPRDGINGSDVTRHMKYIKGVPKTLALPLTLSLNGEIECWNEDFLAINQEREANGEDLYKNPRNYTAGCMGRDDPEENKNARLRVAFYSISGFRESAKYYKTEIERAKWANSADGLNLQETLPDGSRRGYFVQMRLHHFSDLEKLETQSKTLPYYTDGVILKVNNLQIQEEMGHHGVDPINPPRGVIAWKFAEETAEAVISSIEWNASRTGRIVPTAIFNKPFVLADTENTRATCNNYGWMKLMGLGPNAKVLCKKSGKIIPNIVNVIERVSDLGSPIECPSCNSKLILETGPTGNVDLLCLNADCNAKHAKGWQFFIQKLGGKGLGLAAMEKILQSGKVKKLSDLYTLTLEDLLAANFTERQAILALATIFMVQPVKDNKKLLEKIEEARNIKHPVEAWKFFASLGISGTGETAGKILFSHYKDLSSICNATFEELQELEGIGPSTAEAIISYFHKHKQDVFELLQYIELVVPTSGHLSGKNFCLTGSFTEGKKYWENLIEQAGGNIQSSVGKTTHYLVQQHGKSDGTPSSKEEKAAKMGVPTISVQELDVLLKS